MTSSTVTRGWLTIRGAATYASVSPSTIQLWLKRGLVSAKPSPQVRLIRATDIDAFLQSLPGQEGIGR